MLLLATFSSAESGRPVTDAMPSLVVQPPQFDDVDCQTRAGVSMPLLVRKVSTQRVPLPVVWPNRIVIGLPGDQPGSETISFTTTLMSGVVRSSCTPTDGSGCHMTLLAVGVRDDRSPFVFVGAADAVLASP